MEINLDGLISIGILILVAFIIYSKIKKQSLRESYDEFKDLVGDRE